MLNFSVILAYFLDLFILLYFYIRTSEIGIIKMKRL